MSWRLICCNFLGTHGHDETRICPRVVYAQSGAWGTGQFYPGCCWTDEYAPGSVHHIQNLYAQYAKMHIAPTVCILYIFCILISLTYCAYYGIIMHMNLHIGCIFFLHIFFAYYAYRLKCIFCIFIAYLAYCLHIIDCIQVSNPEGERA